MSAQLKKGDYVKISLQVDPDTVVDCQLFYPGCIRSISGINCLVEWGETQWYVRSLWSRKADLVALDVVDRPDFDWKMENRELLQRITVRQEETS